MKVRAYRVFDLELPRSTDVAYRVPGLDYLFLGHTDDLCPDCSNPALSFDLSKPPNEMVYMLWHDPMCPSNPVAKREREVGRVTA